MTLLKNLIANGETYALYSCTSIFIIVGIIIQFFFTTENIDSVWKKEKEEQIESLEVERANQLIQDKINSSNFTKQLLETTEVERIAIDLHDSISHELLTLKFFFTTRRYRRCQCQNRQYHQRRAEYQS